MFIRIRNALLAIALLFSIPHAQALQLPLKQAKRGIHNYSTEKELLYSLNLVRERVLGAHFIVVGHYPCSDGISSLVSISRILGFGPHVTYLGLDHSDAAVMREAIAAAISAHGKNAIVIFSDFVPKLDRIDPKKDIFDYVIHSTEGKIILLDHHDTFIKSIMENQEYLRSIVDANQRRRIFYDLDDSRSGAGISFDFSDYQLVVHGQQESARKIDGSIPTSVSLAQTIDLLTATGDYSVIKQFKTNENEISDTVKRRLETLSTQFGIAEITDSIAFFAVAAAFDNYFGNTYKKYSAVGLTEELLVEAREFFDSLDAVGAINSLMTKGIDILPKDIASQIAALEKAVPIKFMSDEYSVVFVPITIRCGRSFLPILRVYMKRFNWPQIAIVSEVTRETVQKKQNWMAIRAIDDIYDLTGITAQILAAGLAIGGGGHPGAAASQMNVQQCLNFLEIVEEEIAKRKNQLQERATGEEEEKVAA